MVPARTQDIVMYDWHINPRSVRLSLSHCETFKVVVEEFQVPLFDDQGSIPMTRKCSLDYYHGTFMGTLHHATEFNVPKAAVLLVPGFACNSRIFDMCGKVRKGKVDASFQEGLVRRGYDVFAVDLRGTRKSLDIGASYASGLSEYVDVDIPSAIHAITRISGCEKVFLIGHSLGGALCCAVAGAHPHLVSGVVHLAGLYDFSLPFVEEILEVVNRASSKAIPGWARKMMRQCTARVTNMISRLTTSSNDKMDSGSLVTVKTDWSCASESKICKFLRKVVADVRRQPLPLRIGVDVLNGLKKVLPRRLENWIAQCEVAWAAGSIEDVYTFLDESFESPSIGVALDIAQMGVVTTVSKLARFLQGPRDILDCELDELEKNSSRIPKSYRTSSQWSPYYTLGHYFDCFERLPKMPVFVVYANQDRVLRKPGTVALYERSDSVYKHLIEYGPRPHDARSNGTKTVCTKYTVPESYSFGHCDILSGRYADFLWHQICEWLDATTKRSIRHTSRRFSNH